MRQPSPALWQLARAVTIDAGSRSRGEQLKSRDAGLKAASSAVELLDGLVGLAQRLSRLLGRLAKLSQCFADLLCAGRLGGHAFVDSLEARRQGLDLVNDLGQMRADLPDFLDATANFFGKLVHPHNTSGHCGLHFLDHLLDIVRGHGGLVRKAADFHRDHGKSKAVFAGFLGFNGCVERKQVGLVGHLGDSRND